MKTVFLILAVVTGLLASIVPISGTDVWYSQYVAVMLIVFTGITFLISEMSLALACLYFYCTLSTIFICKQDMMPLMCLIQTGGCLLIARMISNLNSSGREKIVNAIFCLLVLQVVWGFVQHFNLDPIFKLSTDMRLSDTVGFSGSHNQYGLFMAVASPVVFMIPILFPILFVGIILSKTISALMGCLAAWSFLLRNRINRFLIISFVIITVIFSAAFLHKDMLSKLGERGKIWQLTWTEITHGKAIVSVNDNVSKIIIANPMFGFGFQKFFQISPYAQYYLYHNKTLHFFEHAHNDYIEALFDLGYLGFCFVLFVMGEMVFIFNFPFHSRGYERSHRLEMATAGLIAYAVCALTIYTVHTAYNGFFLCVLIGLFYGEVKDGTKRRKSGTPCLVCEERQEALRCH